MKSKLYKLNGKLFRYDYDRSVVEYVYKADKETIEEENEWLKTHDRPLYDIDEQGYAVMDSAGLSVKNWKNKEARNEYLSGWAFELDEEAAYLADEFERYELPYLI